MPHIALTLLAVGSLAGESFGSSAGQSSSCPGSKDGACEAMVSDDKRFELMHLKDKLTKKSMPSKRGWPFDAGLGPTPDDYDALLETAATQPGNCSFADGQEQIDFKFSYGVKYSNLGGTGPYLSDPQELRYHRIATTLAGVELDLKITNMSEYTPMNSANNGMLESGTVGQINLMCGTHVELKLEWVQSDTDIQVPLDYVYFAFIDMDNSKHGYDTEMISFYPVSHYWLADGYEFSVDTSMPGVFTAVSTHFGRGCDNPWASGSHLGNVTCNDGVTVDQLLRVVMVGFQSVSTVNLTLGIGPCDAIGTPNKHGRNFVFSGRSTPPGPTSESCATSTTTTTTITTTTTTTVTMIASEVDDPHCVNLAGVRFTVNQPAEYTLLRIPQDRNLPALLDLRGTMQYDQVSKCGLYTKDVTLSGEWFGEKFVHLRSLRRNRPGSNSAGNETEWPFAVQVSTLNYSSESSWTPMDGFAGDNAGVEALTSQVSVAAVWKEGFGKLLEAQSFEFRIGVNHSDAVAPATIVVAQASHQALNIEIRRVGKLRVSAFGGLLGTERHDPTIEELSNECKEAKMEHHPSSQRLTFIGSNPQGSSLIASWS